MTAREEVLAYALSFADVYTERPFRDQNWQLVRIKGSKKDLSLDLRPRGISQSECKGSARMA